jgi:hypothetical protein
MRSSAGTNWALALSVVVLTKLTIACFAGPSLHEGSGSAPGTVSAGEETGPELVGAEEVEGAVVVEQPAAKQPATMSVKNPKIVARRISDFLFVQMIEDRASRENILGSSGMPPTKSFRTCSSSSENAMLEAAVNANGRGTSA